MKRILSALVALAALAFAAAASADTTPPTVPFPKAKIGGVFVSAQTVNTRAAVSSSFAPGRVVIFRAYAVDSKTHKLLTKMTKRYSKGAVRSFYVQIPNGPNVRMRYWPKSGRATGRYRWIGSWRVPVDYPTGVVPFTVHVKTWAKRTGTFAQMPVAAAQLTISTTPQRPFGPGPASSGAVSSSTVDVALYADTVNGTRPAGAPPRPAGCTQTNVWKRGEQMVVRAWGFDLSDGSVLSMDNVTEAHFSLPGQSNVSLNWGAHGATGNKVWFWANAWQIPTDYPLGDVNVHVSFTTLGGKTGTLDYPITIIP